MKTLVGAAEPEEPRKQPGLNVSLPCGTFTLVTKIAVTSTMTINGNPATTVVYTGDE